VKPGEANQVTSGDFDQEREIQIVAGAKPASFDDPAAAVADMQKRYAVAVDFLREGFAFYRKGEAGNRRYRAYYPEIRLRTTSFAPVETLLSFGHVSGPGLYTTTVTRPDLFKDYFTRQLQLLMENHRVSVEVATSNRPIPVHFALPEGQHVEGGMDLINLPPMRDVFDVPDLADMDDAIVNGDREGQTGEPTPLALFTAPRVDYSLHRLAHYTGTSPRHFQNFVIYTNYQFYVDRFIDFAKTVVGDTEQPYTALVEPGNKITGETDEKSEVALSQNPQMPAYHLKMPDRAGITLINIGVGPSNAKTITDHVAVLRPHAWLMLGHCAGLRNSQSLGDFALAHGYVREDNVLNDDIPVSVPIPPLAEVQVALQEAVAEITGLSGQDLKAIMRTGTVATIDNRNWELRDQRGPVKRLSQSRAIALDMESATIAANGFRFRVPYGTLLCVSDKPLHGELKLPGMASSFYSSQVERHLLIGIRALEKLRQMPPERLHSRKLRAFDETAFQ